MLIVGETATLHVSEVNRDSVGRVNLVWLMTKFGAARALDLALGGQPYSGVSLVERGIALRAVPDAHVLEEARAYADLLAENGADGMARTKQIIRHLSGFQDFRALLAESMRLAAS